MRQSILDALDAARRPLSGNELIRRLSRDGRPLFNSQVFRALDQLCRAGRIRKIAVTASYAPGGNSRTVSLLCRHCGGLEEVAAEPAFAAIDAAARRRGFRIARYFVELPGTCRACTATLDMRKD